MAFDSSASWQGWPRQYADSGRGWRVILDEPRPPQEHMARDEQLAAEETPTVRFFLWNPPAVSLGLKQSAPAWCTGPRQRRFGLSVVERPTGGGIALHGSDVSMAVVVPQRYDIPLHALMRAVCDNAARLCRSYALQPVVSLEAPPAGRIAYCLAETSPYAVLLRERKVAGFAVRRFPRTWLIQGSLLVSRLPKRLADALPASVRESLDARATCLADELQEPVSPHGVTERWSTGWADWWDEALLTELAEVSR